jgi:hypothetical protein
MRMCTLDATDTVAVMTDRTPPCAPAAIASQPAIVVHGLTKRYGDHQVLHRRTPESVDLPVIVAKRLAALLVALRWFRWTAAACC